MAGTPEQHIWILRQQLEESAKWLEAETRLKVEWKTKNGQLKADIEERKEAYTKLEKHAKACEKATGKAQRDANHAVGLTNHLLSTQKGQLKSAERRYGEAARDLKQWRDKYGWSVNKPAEENDALQASLSEWQSKAEKAQNVIASLEEQVQGTPDQVGLHQALEEWTEHQACSEEFAKLEDKIHDGLTVKQKLESDLSATKEQYQKALEELQVRVNELEQANKALQPVQVTADQVEQANKTYQGVQVTAEQLEQADKTFQELQGKAGQYELHIQKLQADLEAGKEQHQEVEAYMKALLAVLRQAQQADEASEDQVQTDDINMSDDQIRDEDMLDDETLGQKKLMLGLKALAERYQKKESDQKALQEESDQLASDLKTTKEQWQIAESNMNILQETADQLESSLKTTKDQYQTTKSKMDALQTKADQLEQTNTTLQEEASQLGSDLKTTKEQWQIAESNMNILQETADQLESSLKTTKDQYQTKKSHMDALQTKADQLEQTNTTLQEEASQLELDLKITKDQHQATKSNMDALQTKADQLEQTNTTLQEEASQLEADLKITKEQFHTAKVKMDGLEEQADQLEVANETLHQVTDKVQDELKTTREQYRRANLNMEALQDEASELKKTSGTFEGKTNRKLWSKSDAVPQDIEERMQLVTAQKELSKKAEQDTETSQRSQVTPPSSPIYTTDEVSHDLENTPRPKKSLRQDLGFSSRHQSDEDESDVFMSQPHGAMMPKQAKTGEEEKGGVAEPWETDEPKDAEQNTKDTMPRETQRFLSSKRRVRYPETLAVRAKEQSEVLETLFECTTEEAHAISKRLKVLGPGCRLYEAPPLIAYELSGIPVDTYKGLASGKLIATMPLNEVKDVGTSPEKFAADIGTDTTGLPAEELAGPLIVGNDIATDTADLPTEEVAGPLIVGNDIATDTADLPVEEVTNPKTSFNHWTLLLYGLMIIFGLLCVYMGMKSDPKTGPQYGILYKNIYSHRHTPFATPSSQASTPIIFVHPPSPAPQLGLARMMMGGLLGGGLGGGR